ncbi:MAG TPA: hypothetical protein VMV02_04290 [Acidimicrobiales bacterium]|nr:hypothetical protein [Acidimicrobiales bacterium]
MATTRICPTCLATVSRGYSRCHACSVVARQLGCDLVRVVPVALAPRGGSLHRTLVAYKAAAAAATRFDAASLLAAALSRHLAAFRPAADGRTPFELVATVPSSGPGRASWHGVHPLVEVVRRALDAVDGSRRVAPLEILARGPATLGHLLASRDGYRAVAGPGGRDLARAHVDAAPGAADARPAGGNAARVLVVDDLYTSGARAQSAAFALRRAGLDVVAVVPIGRLVEPACGASGRAA